MNHKQTCQFKDNAATMAIKNISKTRFCKKIQNLTSPYEFGIVEDEIPRHYYTTKFLKRKIASQNRGQSSGYKIRTLTHKMLKSHLDGDDKFYYVSDYDKNQWLIGIDIDCHNEEKDAFKLAKETIQYCYSLGIKLYVESSSRGFHLLFIYKPYVVGRNEDIKLIKQFGNLLSNKFKDFDSNIEIKGYPSTRKDDNIEKRGCLFTVPRPTSEKQYKRLMLLRPSLCKRRLKKLIESSQELISKSYKEKSSSSEVDPEFSLESSDARVRMQKAGYDLSSSLNRPAKPQEILDYYEQLGIHTGPRDADREYRAKVVSDYINKIWGDHKRKINTNKFKKLIKSTIPENQLSDGETRVTYKQLNLFTSLCVHNARAGRETARSAIQRFCETSGIKMNNMQYRKCYLLLTGSNILRLKKAHIPPPVANIKRVIVKSTGVVLEKIKGVARLITAGDKILSHINKRINKKLEKKTRNTNSVSSSLSYVYSSFGSGKKKEKEIKTGVEYKERTEVNLEEALTPEDKALMTHLITQKAIQ